MLGTKLKLRKALLSFSSEEQKSIQGSSPKNSYFKPVSNHHSSPWRCSNCHKYSLPTESKHLINRRLSSFTCHKCTRWDDCPTKWKEKHSIELNQKRFEDKLLQIQKKEEKEKKQKTAKIEERNALKIEPSLLAKELGEKYEGLNLILLMCRKNISRNECTVSRLFQFIVQRNAA